MKKELMDLISLINGSNEVYIFGAGENGKALLECLEKTVKVTAFIDNDEKKHGKLICGIECLSINEAIKRGGTEGTGAYFPK